MKYDTLKSLECEWILTIVYSCQWDIIGGSPNGIDAGSYHGSFDAPHDQLCIRGGCIRDVS